MTISNSKLSSIFKTAIDTIADAGLGPDDLRGTDLTALDEMLNATLEQYPDDPILLKFKGQIHFQQGKHDKAIPYFSKLAAIKPDDADASSYLAYSLFRCEQYVEALPFLNKALDAFPQEFELQFMTGYVLLTQNKREEAAALLAPVLRKYNEDLTMTYGKEVTDIALMGLSFKPPAPEGPAGPAI